MRSIIHFFQPLRRHVRVDLRGRETGVSEQLLDAAKVSTVIQEVRRETVTEAVRSNRLG